MWGVLKFLFFIIFEVIVVQEIILEDSQGHLTLFNLT